MKAELKKFKDTESLVLFCKELLSTTDGDVLLLGSDVFIDNILNNNKDNITDIEREQMDNNKENNLKKRKYKYALIEEDYIKDLKEYSKVIQNEAYILHNEEDNHVLNIVDNIKNNKCEHCDECNSDNFEEEVDDVIDQYLDILDYIDIDDYDSKKEILFELANAFYNVGSIMTKTAIANELIDSAEDDMNNLEED